MTPREDTPKKKTMNNSSGSKKHSAGSKKHSAGSKKPLPTRFTGCYRVSAEDCKIGLLIGRGGSNLQRLVTNITDLDSDKVAASKTRISLKNSGEIKGKVNFRDLPGTDVKADSFIYFFVTVTTKNVFDTMRNVEGLLGSFVKYYFPELNDGEVEDEMFEEAVEDDGGW